MLAEGARLAAADGIGVRVFGPARELGPRRRRGDRGRRRPPSGSATTRTRSRRCAPSPRPRSCAPPRDVAEGGADAMVSPGSTGATMAAATFGLRRLKGVQRPALAVQLPVPGKPVLFLDVGANVEVRAQHLVQFAFLGAAFSAAVLEVERPRGRPALGRRGVGQGARGGRRGPPRCSPRRRGIDFAGNVEGARPARRAPSTSSSPTASPATSR